MSKMSESPIRIKSFAFAVDIVQFSKTLKTDKEYELASQLMRSGTSIGANVREAQRDVSLKILKINLELLLKKLKKPSIGWNSLTLA